VSNLVARDAALGSGWAFPVGPDVVRGSLRYRTGAEKVRESLLLILATDPGERVMRPEFGCGLRRWLFAPNTLTTRAAIEREVRRAIQRWEPRVVVAEVAVTPGDDPVQLLVAIRYEHVRDGRGDVLVYPLYLEG
jgi:uncharacterized protein